MKVLVSDEIADSIDVNQFYESPSSEGDISLKLNLGSEILTGPVSRMGILGDGRIKIDFICDSDGALSFILCTRVEDISLYYGDVETLARKYINFDVVSKSFKLMKNRRYECDLIVMMSNT